MTSSPTANYKAFDGTEFKFVIMCNAPWDMDGVIVPPGTNIYHEEFIDALNWAQDLYPFLRAREYVSEWKEYLVYGESSVDHETLIMVRRAHDEDVLPVSDEILRIVDDLLEGRISQRPSIERKKSKPQSGYVYLLKSAEGHYKIGKAKNPENRLETFTVKLPFRVEYVCLIKTDDMRTLEETLHDYFSDKRINGEWFNLSSEDVEYIKGLAT